MLIKDKLKFKLAKVVAPKTNRKFRINEKISGVNEKSSSVSLF